MSRSLDVRPLGDESELGPLGDILGWSFGFPPEDSTGWLTRAGLDNVRVAYRGSELVAGLLLVPMGQWFGGQSVPMTGIAGVGVAPEARGTGVAKALMSAALTELSGKGVALSALYPATLPLYRGVGYAIAGSRLSMRVRPRDIALRTGELGVRPIEEADEAPVASLYSDFARRVNGYLDRGEYIWKRVRAPRDGKASGYLVEQEGRVRGYLYVRQKPTATGHYELRLSDAVATSAEAGRTLLAFLGSHHTLGDAAVWFGGLDHPLLALMPERGVSVALADPWMLRISDTLSALRARGYAPGVSTEVELDVRDEVLPACRGRFVLRVDGGRCEVSRGGGGAVSLDVRGLAALYSGFASPWALARQGLLSGDEPALARAAVAFAGSAPAMPDMF